MKRRIWAVLVAVCLVLSLVPTAFAEEGPAQGNTAGDRDTTGYWDEALPTGPDMSGTVVTVTPENAQYTLDGAYGSIDGKTIHFSAGTYPAVLILGRPTKFTGSGTKFYSPGNDTELEYAALQKNGFYQYRRTVENVTFTADEGVVLPGFSSMSSHVYGAVGKPAYDYVRETTTESSVGSYHAYSSMKNMTFDGLTIGGSIEIYNSLPGVEHIGYTYKNCTFTGDPSKMSTNTFTAIRMMTEAGCNHYDTILVENCKIGNYFQGIIVQGPKDITIKNCVIDNTTHNGIALQNTGSNNTSPSVEVAGNVQIIENIVRNTQDRAVRFGIADDVVMITVENNVFLNASDSAGEVIKAQSIPTDTNVIHLENNYWSGLDVSTAVNSSLSAPTQTGVTGGSFPEDVSQYAAEGYTAVYVDGVYTPVKAVESLTLDRAQLSLEIGKSTELKAEVSPEGAGGSITWSSDNEAVAKVDQNGTVTAVAAGKAVITAAVGGVSAACDVTVSAPYVPVPPVVPVQPVTPTQPTEPDTPDTPDAPDIPAPGYADVSANDWFYDEVAYVTAKGLMTGTTPTAFAPNATTTRAMVWTILGRMTDAKVDGGEPWYSLAQSWAVTNGVSDGTNPNGSITREELAAMLYRYADSPAVGLPELAKLGQFTDGEAVSHWAQEAMAWAVSTGIISGSNGAVLPQQSATRAEVAAMLMRFCENLDK